MNSSTRVLIIIIIIIIIIITTLLSGNTRLDRLSTRYSHPTCSSRTLRFAR
jgi:hypothetical protein